MISQHGTPPALPFGLPPWVWVGISTFVAFVLGFVVMVEGIYRFHAPPAARIPTGAQREASGMRLSDAPVDQSAVLALPPPPAWIVRYELPAGDFPSEAAAQPNEGRSEVTVAADAVAGRPALPAVSVEQGSPPHRERETVLPPQPNGKVALPALGQRRSSRAEDPALQSGEALAPTESPPREQMAVWRRQNAWVILLVRYGYEQGVMAERTWQRLRDKVPAGLRLLRVESRDHREWLLLLGAFPTQEAAQVAAQQLPPELIVRRPHLQVVAVRNLF